jgi:hypothetical protein
MDGFSEINTFNTLEKDEIKIELSSKNDAYNKRNHELYMNKKENVNHI